MSFRASKQLRRICKSRKADFDFTYLQWAVTGELYGQGDELREQLAYLRRVYSRRFGQRQLKRLLTATGKQIAVEKAAIIERAQEATSPRRA